MGTFGVSATMTVATTAGAIFASATTSFAASVSVGGSRTWTSSKAQSTATSQSKSGGIMVDVKSPGGAMIVGFVKKYKMDKSNIPVTMTVYTVLKLEVINLLRNLKMHLQHVLHGELEVY